MQWHEPRPISTLKNLDDWPSDAEAGGKVLVYNPCDGWHLLWTMEYPHPDSVLAFDCFEYWMPAPPEPTNFDREVWRDRSLEKQLPT